jgi:trans-aconitate methyltransferase
LFLRTFDNNLGLAPPNLPGSNVERVLDVGTGTGIWAIEFADDHPEAEVKGSIQELKMLIADIIYRFSGSTFLPFSLACTV